MCPESAAPISQMFSCGRLPILTQHLGFVGFFKPLLGVLSPWQGMIAGKDHHRKKNVKECSFIMWIEKNLGYYQGPTEHMRLEDVRTGPDNTGRLVNHERHHQNFSPPFFWNYSGPVNNRILLSGWKFLCHGIFHCKEWITTNWQEMNHIGCPRFFYSVLYCNHNPIDKDLVLTA